MQIFPLKAKHGDAIIVKLESQTKQYTFIIDGGPSETAEEIADVYDNLGYIDVLILTHYDEDHISGLIEFFSRHKEDKEEKIGQVWVNGAHLIYYDDDENTAVAYDNAFNLASCLKRLKSHGFIGQWRDSLTNEEKPIITDDYRIDILSPTKNILETLEKKFHDYVDEHGLQDDSDMDEEVSFQSCNFLF
uniref:MBL fold metallo-hydrolase n=1 Tax=Prevotella sp. TaxID=59823 RepID=UPI0040273A0C